jgi:hypothetical protein
MAIIICFLALFITAFLVMAVIEEFIVHKEIKHVLYVVILLAISCALWTRFYILVN